MEPTTYFPTPDRIRIGNIYRARDARLGLAESARVTTHAAIDICNLVDMLAKRPSEFIVPPEGVVALAVEGHNVAAHPVEIAAQILSMERPHIPYETFADLCYALLVCVN